ncbi:MAG: hypothetical protein IPP14_08305 [Planctomycetes bacterium]|nr:hypothetical protein [Planctomycetota bacterium]
MGTAELVDDSLVIAAGFKMGRDARRASGASRAAAAEAEGPQCFIAGTLVLAASRTSASGCSDATGKPIENIEIGDWVWSRELGTGEEGFKPVVQLFRNSTQELVHLTCISGTDDPDRAATLIGTPGHPFWSITRNSWVSMGDLRVGERLSLAGGLTTTATNVRIERLATPVTVYNFEVADWHTYHVGSTNTGWVWVHNKNCEYNAGSGRFHDTDTGRFVKTPAKNKVLRPDAQATLYQKVGANREHLKWGDTFHKNPRLRYPKTQIGDGDVLRVRRGQRQAMLADERLRVETDPGPENLEPWAGWRKPGHPNYRRK